MCTHKDTAVISRQAMAINLHHFSFNRCSLLSAPADVCYADFMPSLRDFLSQASQGIVASPMGGCHLPGALSCTVSSGSPFLIA